MSGSSRSFLPSVTTTLPLNILSEEMSGGIPLSGRSQTPSQPNLGLLRLSNLLNQHRPHVHQSEQLQPSNQSQQYVYPHVDFGANVAHAKGYHTPAPNASSSTLKIEPVHRALYSNTQTDQLIPYTLKSRLMGLYSLCLPFSSLQQCHPSCSTDTPDHALSPSNTESPSQGISVNIFPDVKKNDVVVAPEPTKARRIQVQVACGKPNS